jgi:hypothetical protein
MITVQAIQRTGTHKPLEGELSHVGASSSAVVARWRTTVSAWAPCVMTTDTRTCSPTKAAACNAVATVSRSATQLPVGPRVGGEFQIVIKERLNELALR